MKKKKNKKPAKKLSYEKPVLKKLAMETAHGGCKTGSVAQGVCGAGGMPSSNCNVGTIA